MRKTLLISYASSFVSYLIDELKGSLAEINQIILFGSAARGDAGKDSDVDLFIDVNDEDVESRVLRAVSNFNRSTLQKNYWDLLGVRNRISFICGKLDEWKDVKESILANGIILYSKYRELPGGTAGDVLISWENVKPASKRVMLHARIFGSKNIPVGMLEIVKGTRLGKGSILVPIERAEEVLKIFKGLGVKYMIMHVTEHGR